MSEQQWSGVVKEALRQWVDPDAWDEGEVIMGAESDIDLGGRDYTEAVIRVEDSGAVEIEVGILMVRTEVGPEGITADSVRDVMHRLVAAVRAYARWRRLHYTRTRPTIYDPEVTP